jgi:hypothetical protein
MDPDKVAPALQIINKLCKKDIEDSGPDENVMPLLIGLMEAGVGACSLGELTLLCIYVSQAGGEMSPWGLMATLDMIRENVVPMTLPSETAEAHNEVVEQILSLK